MINSIFEFCNFMKKDQDDMIKTYIENAIQWAKAYEGKQEYKFKCLAFVEDAYEYGNNIEMFGGSTAKESADQYGVCNSSPPSKGSFVFFDTEGPINGIIKNWGHVGLCLGEGKIIHTWNIIRIDHYQEICALISAPGWSSFQYLGWTPPEVFLKGHRKKN